MTDSHPSPGDSASPEADLLDFIPVVRKIKRPDGWTPELQREFIRRVALNGSPQQTCTEMGKHVTGVEALYKVPGADSFRAAWDEAVRIGRSAQGLDCGPPHLGPVPGINRRPPRNAAAGPSDFAPDDEEPEIDEETKAALFENIIRKSSAKWSLSARRGWPGASSRPISRFARSPASRSRSISPPAASAPAAGR